MLGRARSWPPRPAQIQVKPPANKHLYDNAICGYLSLVNLADIFWAEDIVERALEVFRHSVI